MPAASGGVKTNPAARFSSANLRTTEIKSFTASSDVWTCITIREPDNLSGGSSCEARSDISSYVTPTGVGSKKIFKPL